MDVSRRRGAALVSVWVLKPAEPRRCPAVPQSATARVPFAGPAGLPLAASFDAGRLTSDGGAPWLAEADAARGVCAALADRVPEWRHGPVRHALVDLVRQR